MVCFLFEITYYLLFIVKQTKQFYMSAFKIFQTESKDTFYLQIVESELRIVSSDKWIPVILQAYKSQASAYIALLCLQCWLQLNLTAGGLLGNKWTSNA